MENESYKSINELVQIRKYLCNYLLKNNTKIIDIGGNKTYYNELCSALSPAIPYLLNIKGDAIEGIKNSFIGDGCHTNFPDESWDIVISLDTIEHIIEPADLITEAHRILKKGGILCIGTPNLASIYNRCLLLFGLPPYMYNPSRYRTASLLSNMTIDNSGHKSVFTFIGLKKLLELLGFKCVYQNGYAYPSKAKFYDLKKEIFIRDKRIRFDDLRIFLDRLIPSSMKEASLFICEKR